MALEKPVAPTPPKPPVAPQKQSSSGNSGGADNQQSASQDSQNNSFGVHITVTQPGTDNNTQTGDSRTQTQTQTVANDGNKPVKGTSTKTVSESTKNIPSAAQEMNLKEEQNTQLQTVRTNPPESYNSMSYMPAYLLGMVVVGVVLFMFLTKKKHNADNTIKLSKKQDSLKTMEQKIARVPADDKSKQDDKTHGSFEIRI